MSMDDITYTHPDYDNNERRWEFFLRSYMGGQDYKDGQYLTRYINEDKDEYQRRISLTPIDNHCRNIVHIYSSYLWRIPPTRNFNALDGNVALEPFLKDCDLDGRSFNGFMKEAQIWASVYGHVWIMLDKPKSNVGTKAEELQQGIRPYVTLFTPENVFDWRWERTESGRFKLTYLKVRESIENIDKTSKRAFFRIWTEEEVQVYEVTDEMERLVETLPNPIGRIPAVFLPSNRSVVRGIGISDLTDIAYMQQAIYQELSEIEQLIRISNHPTLVKTYSTDASAGAGSVINVPDELDANLKPYQIQPNGGNLDSVRAAIMDKVEAINRMAHMGAVRGTEAQTKSGVALQTEFQLLNARLSEKADILQLCEEQLWEMFCVWQGVTPDVEVYYPDSFDLRDYPNELAFLQQARASGVRSNTFLKGVDKMIADLILDDEELNQAHAEIDSTNQVLGQF
jgi:hypothetical protein